LPAPLDEDMVDELNWLAAAVCRVWAAWMWRAWIQIGRKCNWKPFIL
jgi:hypothetical protein